MLHHLLASQDLLLCYLFKKKGRIKIDYTVHLSSQNEFFQRLGNIRMHAVGWPTCGKLNYTKA